MKSTAHTQVQNHGARSFWKCSVLGSFTQPSTAQLRCRARLSKRLSLVLSRSLRHNASSLCFLVSLPTKTGVVPALTAPIPSRHHAKRSPRFAVHANLDLFQCTPGQLKAPSPSPFQARHLRLKVRHSGILHHERARGPRPCVRSVML